MNREQIINNMCMTFRHDYGLRISEDDRMYSLMSGMTEREAMCSLVAGTPSSEVLTRVESRLKEVKGQLVRPIDRLAKTTGLVTKGLIEANNELQVQLAQERAFIQLAQQEADRR